MALLAETSWISSLITEDNFVYLLIAVSIVTVMLVRILAGVITTTSRERTKREIAAYIAEGSMSPEQGERILAAEDKT